MSITSRVFERIRLGRTGQRPPSLRTGYVKYDYDIGGVMQGQYILVGGETGTGKSKFIRSTYVHTVYDHFMRVSDLRLLDVEFIDFSLELTEEDIWADGISRRLFMDHKLVLTRNEILQKGVETRKLTQEEEVLVDLCEPYFEMFERTFSIVGQETNERVFHDALMEAALRNGSFDTQADHISNCGVWTPNNPNKMIIVLLDTLNIVDKEQSAIAKGVMDNISRLAVWYRNKCKFTFVIVQQFNSDLSDFQRAMKGISTPILKDFMDSTRPTKDCDVAIGLYAPYKHFKADRPTFKDYDLIRMGPWLETLHVLKNRYGPSTGVVPLKFDGAVGLFTELPHALSMTDEEYRRATTH